MTLDSLSEPSLLRLEGYLNSNPYREYSMSKSHIPKASHYPTHSHRLISQQQASMLPFQELMDNQKDTLTLDRLAYKLRMKSDLNIDTLRDSHARRRRQHRRFIANNQNHHQQQQSHHHSQTQSIQSNHTNSMVSDGLSSVPSTISGKTFARQPTSITMSTQTMKSYGPDDIHGIEGNAVRVGTLDDLIKQFRRSEYRLVRRPPDYLDSASTFLSSSILTNDRNGTTKSHQRPVRVSKQPHGLTEYQFNVPTIPTTPSRIQREPIVHQGLIYQYRTRERIQNIDLPLLNQRSVHSPEQQRPRLNSLIVPERQPTALSSHDRRIQELREKSLMRTEKQLCVCNKLTIVDPFTSNSDQNDSILPQLQHSKQQTPANYIFPPVRPFGYLTKKAATNEDGPQVSINSPLSQKKKKKRGLKQKPHKLSKHSLDSLDKLAIGEMTNDEDDSSLVLNETLPSMISLTDFDDESQHPMNVTVNVELKVTDDHIPTANGKNQS